MQGKGKKIISIIIVLLIIMELGFIIYNSINAKIMKNKLKKIKDNNSTSALMIQQTEDKDDYEEVEDDAWPSSGYKFNKDKSYCLYVDYNSEDKVRDILDFKDGKAIVKTTKTTYCYLYFDIKQKTDITFYLGGKTNPDVVDTAHTKAYLKWQNNDNISEYCLSSQPNVNNCTETDWHSFSNAEQNAHETEVNFTLSSNNGDKTYYAYFKEKDGNIIEEYGIDTIRLWIVEEEPTIPNLRSICKDRTLAECIPVEPVSKLETIPNLNCNQGGMCRYQGSYSTVNNNYICFGSSDSNKCKTDINRGDQLLYRIIGVTPDGKLKLIKKEALNWSYTWSNNMYSNTNWQFSNVYQAINGFDYLYNSYYIPSDWLNRIDYYNWIYGDLIGSNFQTPSVEYIYNIETGTLPANWYIYPGVYGGGFWNQYAFAQIGLMYMHDYNYSVQKSGMLCMAMDCSNSWIHLWKNDTYVTDNLKSESLITHNGYGAKGQLDQSFSIIVNNDGYENIILDTAPRAVRPVFYLANFNLIKSGDGTFTNPYVLSD